MVKEESDIKSKYALNNLRHQANILLLFEPVSQLFVNLQATYKDRVGSYLGYDFNQQEYTEHSYSDYWMLQAKMSWQAEKFQYHIEASNITNVQIVEYGVPQPGFWLMAGIKYHIPL